MQFMKSGSSHCEKGFTLPHVQAWAVTVSKQALETVVQLQHQLVALALLLQGHVQTSCQGHGHQSLVYVCCAHLRPGPGVLSKDPSKLRSAATPEHAAPMYALLNEHFSYHCPATAHAVRGGESKAPASTGRACSRYCRMRSSISSTSDGGARFRASRACAQQPLACLAHGAPRSARYAKGSH